MKIGGEFNTKRTWYVTPLNQSDKKKYGHPTIKPLEILQNLIVNSSEPDDIVLDPFLGSGSTCVAAVNTGRHYVGFELDPGYFGTACQRLDEAEEKMLQKEYC